MAKPDNVIFTFIGLLFVYCLAVDYINELTNNYGDSSDTYFPSDRHEVEYYNRRPTSSSEEIDDQYRETKKSKLNLQFPHNFQLSTDHDQVVKEELSLAPSPEPEISEDFQRLVNVMNEEEPNELSGPVEFVIPLTAVIGFLPVNRRFLRPDQHRCRCQYQIQQQGPRPYGHDVVAMSGGVRQFPDRWTSRFSHVEEPRFRFGPDEENQQGNDHEQEQVEQMLENKYFPQVLVNAYI
ncbi:hypothetical protein TIFTF001_003341 [Ficus carica]|uniref:Uncharacterized protein n=1 Tax=Ficus carica TaxID=3494 RepID=A0AA87ZRB0_FICCA|nr:hypothetical protein TIFTF001_003341 [Ficus carica]